MPLTSERNFYKPLEYPWAFEAYHTQQKMHWLPEEVPMHTDIVDWREKLTGSERELITQILRFFTQGDVDIAKGYIEKYMQWFKPPEVRMMLSAFASMEAVHVHAYSLLIDTIGLPEIEYSKFQKFQEMKDKHEYLFSQKEKPSFYVGITRSFETTASHTHTYPYEQYAREEEQLSRLRDIAVFSAFGEGMQLFSSFVILLNFKRRGLMRGMGQIIEWSIRDESHHVSNMIRLFHEYAKETIGEEPGDWSDEFKRQIYQVCRDMVDLEDKFIDLAFGGATIEGLDKDEVKQYIRFIADRRLLQLGLKPNYGVKKNPLDWLDWILNTVEHTNFFENRATEYAKGNLTGSWDQAFEIHKVAEASASS